MNISSAIKNWYLYVITDEQLSKGRSHVEIARAAIAGGADVIQLRDKTASSRKLYEDALAIRKITRDAHVIFIVNDRLDIALAVEADGVHVGQKDVPASVARQLIGENKILGVSAETVEEAIQAEKDGADAIIVSNHGGRQLDGAPSSIEALPSIVAEVGSKIEVHMDGGIRSGQDVLKAWALGARGTYIGRAMAYGVGAMGEAGVTKALEIIHKELDITMALCGRTDIRDVDRSILVPGTYPT